MPRVALLLLACLLPALLQASPRPATPASQVTIYRCTDDAGRVALRDTPCRADSSQEVRNMVRPKDAPVAPPTPARDASAPAAPAAPAIESRVLVLRTPQPMYECTTPDGDRYTSASAEGNPRWLSMWAAGIPVQAGGHDLAITGGRIRIGGDGVALAPPLPAAPWPANAVTWVRDACHALPQAEVCARLRDERREVDRRYFNAQPSEQDVLRLRKRGLQARLQADCA